MIDLTEVSGEDLAFEIYQRRREGEVNVEDAIEKCVRNFFDFDILFPDKAQKIQDLEERNEELERPDERTEEIIRCAHAIAFGDLSRVFELRRLFADQGVYGGGAVQLEELLGRHAD